tara:strand:+ start:265 stop:666 length:402 start_codon:yes stop_codon:yes gene_type:complete
LAKTGISPALPLAYTKEDGPYGLNKNVRDAIQQNFKNLLLTTKGERVMIPEFGVGLRSFLFRNFTTSLLEEIRAEINKQVDTYLPFIEITELDFLTSDDQPDDISLNQINLRIRYEILPINEADTLTIFESVN